MANGEDIRGENLNPYRRCYERQRTADIAKMRREGERKREREREKDIISYTNPMRCFEEIFFSADAIIDRS